jgi:hypothetical protein
MLPEKNSALPKEKVGLGVSDTKEFGDMIGG